MIIVLTVAVNALIMTIWERVDARANKRKLPLGSLAQLAKGIAWLIAAIVIIAVIVDKSPLALLTGLGAFSAVLMLIFKNNILSVVAGVQLSENDSLHVGDWISVPAPMPTVPSRRFRSWRSRCLTGTRPRRRSRHIT